MAHNKFDGIIPWFILKKHLEQRQRTIDSQLRRTSEPEASNLRGQALLLEELLNLPETLRLLEDQDIADGK